jgi:hypothetical protein
MNDRRGARIQNGVTNLRGITNIAFNRAAPFNEFSVASRKIIEDDGVISGIPKCFTCMGANISRSTYD